METGEASICPVCGGENEQRSSCTFCGARLEPRGASSAGPSVDAPPGGPAPAASPRDAAWAPEPLPEALPGAGGAGFRAEIRPAPGPRFAGFWIRVCAYVTDAIVIQVVIWLLLSVAMAGYSLGSSGTLSRGAFGEIYQSQWGSIAGMDILAKLAYYTLFLGRSGRTPGKKLFGLRVIRTDGGPVTHGQALIRTIGYYINMFTLWIGFLWVAFDRRKQGFHDKIAGTLEIRE